MTLLDGLALTPLLFGQRILPTVHFGAVALAGLTPHDLKGRLLLYNTELQSQLITITIRDQTKQYTGADLGIMINPNSSVSEQRWQFQPQMHVNASQLQTTIARDFATVMTVPKNASLRLNARGNLEQLPNKTGEAINLAVFTQRLSDDLQHNQPLNIEPPIIPTPALLTEANITPTAAFTAQLLQTGLTLQGEDKTWVVAPPTLRRLLIFNEKPIPENQERYRLSAQLDQAGLADYLTITLASKINHPAQDARFTIGEDGKVKQLAVPEIGQTLNIDETVARINAALERYKAEAELAVTASEPAIQDQADIESLDLTALLATGETNFTGSPANRIHNIKVGAAHYHGLLIPPGAIFSFNQFLGPVTAATGYKPELVIKHNKTIPEYGGGLCQVSTTVFRAAALAGLGITERRNHAYAVRYYGTPGFDATIYPPATDFKFTNDTDGYVLMQTKIEGTNLSIELWGKADGREVAIDGPHPYDRQPDGAVKATLKRLVRRGETVLHDDTFYSRYRSPSLFPKPNENPLP